MIKIQLGWTTDQLERLLMTLVEEWDELERWAIRNGAGMDKVKVASGEKDKLLAKISEIRATDNVG